MTVSSCSYQFNEALRAGLSKVARKVGGACPARCGGDLGSPRKPAGPAPAKRGLPAKAGLPAHPKNT